MKKINGGIGEELEVSDDIADIIDPNSLLEDHIPTSNAKVDSGSVALESDNIFGAICLCNEKEEYSISSIFQKLTITHTQTEYEFVILKKLFFEFLGRLQDSEIQSITFTSKSEKHNFDFKHRKIKKFVFESFAGQIKCTIVI